MKVPVQRFQWRRARQLGAAALTISKRGLPRLRERSTLGAVPDLPFASDGDTSRATYSAEFGVRS
jgi:hypothetical protein